MINKNWIFSSGRIIFHLGGFVQELVFSKKGFIASVFVACHLGKAAFLIFFIINMVCRNKLHILLITGKPFCLERLIYTYMHIT